MTYVWLWAGSVVVGLSAVASGLWLTREGDRG